MERSIEQRKRYDEPFKQAAVQFFDKSGKTLEEVSAELGLQAADLRSWNKRFGPATQKKAAKTLNSVAQLRAENQVLRDEIRHLKVQWDILRTTLGILSTTVCTKDSAV